MTTHDFKSYILGRGIHAGYEWMMSHNGLGYRCGYVRIPRSHPWFGKDYSFMDRSVEVHGGLTYSGHLLTKHDWWVGFDCAHCWDAQDPNLPTDVPMPPFGRWADDAVVRTQAYVQAECEKLCVAVKEAAK